jgi:lysophospholipase L1-like esterase
MKKHAHDNPFAGDIFKEASEREKYHYELKTWVKHDIEEMIQRAKARGIKVILQTYPYYDKGDHYENLSYINEVLREIPEKVPVVFIDHERIFDRMFTKGEIREEYFDSAQVHCNEKGYKAMAENVYCGLLTHHGLGILPDGDPAEKDRCFERLGMDRPVRKSSL